MSQEPKLTEIAQRIAAHLARMEAAQTPTEKAKPGLLWNANAWAAGSRVGVRYVSYQATSFLRKADALTYLARLDAGHNERHFTSLSFNTRIREATKP
jgi:hypothetical protein